MTKNARANGMLMVQIKGEPLSSAAIKRVKNTRTFKRLVIDIGEDGADEFIAQFNKALMKDDRVKEVVPPVALSNDLER